MRLKQSFRNKTDKPQFINLELSTSRYRLNPNEELILFYDADQEWGDAGAALSIEFITVYDRLELVIWTGEVDMFFADGRTAPQDFDCS